MSLYANSVVETRLAVYGFLANFGARRFPKGNEGKRVSSGYNRRRRLATRSSGKQQAERTAVRTAPIVCPEESPLVRPQAHTPCPGWGPDAPTTARMVGLPPRVGQYFLSKRKKVPKKASGTATTGKSPLLPILTAGLAMSRAMELDSYHLRLERARARLFPPTKWAGLFPSAAYRRSALPQLALGRLKWRCLGCLDADCVASQHRKTGLIFSSVIGVIHTQIVSLGMLWCKVDIFATQKPSVVSNPRWVLLRAGGPVARRRSLLYKQHGAIPNRRAARPVAERR